MTTWQGVGDVLSRFITNPYLVGTVAVAVLSFIGVLSDPTTKGIADSEQAMKYDKPKE
jgi:phi LC3 family holin